MLKILPLKHKTEDLELSERFLNTPKDTPLDTIVKAEKMSDILTYIVALFKSLAKRYGIDTPLIDSTQRELPTSGAILQRSSERNQVVVQCEMSVYKIKYIGSRTQAQTLYTLFSESIQGYKATHPECPDRFMPLRVDVSNPGQIAIYKKTPYTPYGDLYMWIQKNTPLVNNTQKDKDKIFLSKKITLIRFALDILREIYTNYQKGTIHADLKPDNVLLVSEKKDEIKANIIDYELAHHLTPDPLIQKYMATWGRGTLEYADPYILDPENKGTPYRYDILPLLGTLFALFHGYNIFMPEVYLRRPTIEEKKACVKEVSETIKKTLENPKKPKQHYFRLPRSILDRFLTYLDQNSDEAPMAQLEFAIKKMEAQLQKHLKWEERYTEKVKLEEIRQKELDRRFKEMLRL